MTRILILLASLLVVGNALALSPCPPDGFRNCFGTYTWADGDKYVGEWKDDKSHGQGIYTSASGDQYVGEFRNNDFNGQGTLTWGKGQWEGDKYVGGFKDDKQHGQGTYTSANGDKYVGENRDNDSWEGIQYSVSGQVLGTYSNGKWCEGCKPTARQLAIVDEIESGQIATIQTTQQKPTLTIKSNPAYASVYIDNAYKSTTPLKIQLAPDNYSIRVSKNGYNNFSQRIELNENMVLWASLSKIQEPKPEPDYKLIGTGTGFVVNKHYVVTAEHVLEDCNAVSIVHGHREIDAQTAARDTSNDLGLLRLNKPLLYTAKLRGGKPIRLGERISNYGYPLFGEISTSATITEGNINNLSGAGNDSTTIQFDAPTQPGNSGGPLLDSSGNVVGVAIKILSKKYADTTGHIAQNVNFAVKSSIVEGFLRSHNIPFDKANSTEKLELPDIAEKAETFTVLVGCWNEKTNRSCIDFDVGWPSGRQRFLRGERNQLQIDYATILRKRWV